MMWKLLLGNDLHTEYKIFNGGTVGEDCRQIASCEVTLCARPMSQPIISCRGLHKTYPGKPPVEAVRGIDLDVAEGECFGVLGPNGAGKTTSIEIMEGLLPASSGVVEVLGQRWEVDADAIRQQIGISLQETQFSDKLSVLETLTLFRSFYRQGIDPRAAMERVSL